MRDVRFYLEFPNRSAKKRSGKLNLHHSGNVFARFSRRMDGLGSVYSRPNSQVASTTCSSEFLLQCKRISETIARKIHPALFVRLDSTDVE